MNSAENREISDTTVPSSAVPTTESHGRQRPPHDAVAIVLHTRRRKVHGASRLRVRAVHARSREPLCGTISRRASGILPSSDQSPRREASGGLLFSIGTFASAPSISYAAEETRQTPPIYD